MGNRQAAVPVDMRWSLPDDLAAAVRTHPHRLRLVETRNGTVSVQLTVLPQGTVPYRLPDSALAPPSQ